MSGKAIPAASVEARPDITPLTPAQIAAFKPFTYFASAGYCDSSATATWTCGPICDANPTFKPVASGGDGDDIQFCEEFLFRLTCTSLSNIKQGLLGLIRH